MNTRRERALSVATLSLLAITVASPAYRSGLRAQLGATTLYEQAVDQDPAASTNPSGWRAVTGRGYGNSFAFHMSQPGDTQEIHWTFAGLQRGATYEVNITYPVFPINTMRAVYTADDGAGTTVSMDVNQTQQPAGKSKDAVAFTSMGTLTLRGTTLTVTLRGTGDGKPVLADAVWVKQIAEAADQQTGGSGFHPAPDSASAGYIIVLKTPPASAPAKPLATAKKGSPFLAALAGLQYGNPAGDSVVSSAPGTAMPYQPSQRETPATHSSTPSFLEEPPTVTLPSDHSSSFAGDVPPVPQDQGPRTVDQVRLEQLAVRKTLFQSLPPGFLDESNPPALGEQYVNVLNAFSVTGTLPQETIDALKADPLVAGVYPIQFAEFSDEPGGIVIPAELVPPSPPTRAVRGTSVAMSTVRVGVIDSGIDYHHRVFGNCFATPGCRIAGGYSFGDGKPDPLDLLGHGTHVASVIAGNDFGLSTAQLFAYKVNAGSSDRIATDKIIAAIERSVDPNTDGDTRDHLDIINMSLGTPATDTNDPLVQAVERATSLGVTVVTAAGNSGSKQRTVMSPGVAPSAITVGAASLNSQGTATDAAAYAVTTFSSRGPTLQSLAKPDVLGLGMNVCGALAKTNAYDGRATCGNRTDLVALNGTSMASAWVSGVVAQIKAAHSQWTPAQVKAALRGTGGGSFDVTTINSRGYGMVDRAAVTSLGAPYPVVQLLTAGRLAAVTNIRGIVPLSGVARTRVLLRKPNQTEPIVVLDTTTIPATTVLVRDFDASTLDTAAPSYLVLEVTDTEGRVSRDVTMVINENAAPTESDDGDGDTPPCGGGTCPKSTVPTNVALRVAASQYVDSGIAAVTYTVQVVNAGAQDASAVTLLHHFPTISRYTFDANASDPRCTVNARDQLNSGINCTVASVPKGTTATYALVFRTTQGCTEAKMTQQSYILSSNPPDDNAADNSVDTLIDTRCPHADLGVTFTGAATAERGQPFGYTVTLTNEGPAVALKPSINVRPFAGFALDTATLSPACNVQDQYVTCGVDALSAHSSTAFALAFKPLPAKAPCQTTTLANNVSVQPYNAAYVDGNTANDRQDFAITLTCPMSIPAVCGNKILETGEECDDGNYNDWDNCTNQCVWGCSGGNSNPYERSEVRLKDWYTDKVTVTPDSCGLNNERAVYKVFCGKTTTGNRQVQVTRYDCADGCRNGACVDPADPPKCGNQVVDPGEECDDGNADTNDFCTNDCLIGCSGGNKDIYTASSVRLLQYDDTYASYPDQCETMRGSRNTLIKYSCDIFQNRRTAKPLRIFCANGCNLGACVRGGN